MGIRAICHREGESPRSRLQIAALCDGENDANASGERPTTLYVVYRPGIGAKPSEVTV